MLGFSNRRHMVQFHEMYRGENARLPNRVDIFKEVILDSVTVHGSRATMMGCAINVIEL